MDSIQVCNLTHDFFHWYINAINGKSNAVFKPGFIENTDGMTTLDFKAYFENLKRLGFSDQLLQKERDSYRECLAHIEKVTYSDFTTSFTDIDPFENMGCDFGNHYRWIGGQEPIQGIRIKKVIKESEDKVALFVEYVFAHEENQELTVWGNNQIRFQRINGDWKIDGIDYK